MQLFILKVIFTFCGLRVCVFMGVLCDGLVQFKETDGTL